ncbi:MAG: hypothetical protein K8S56_09110, partial [Candidatus Cloacimonetes bacterium]|nr:hypothetical protein [Candidatus Cloacimonadota bacterium]
DNETFDQIARMQLDPDFESKTEIEQQRLLRTPSRIEEILKEVFTDEGKVLNRVRETDNWSDKDMEEAISRIEKGLTRLENGKLDEYGQNVHDGLYEILGELYGKQSERSSMVRVSGKMPAGTTKKQLVAKLPESDRSKKTARKAVEKQITSRKEIETILSDVEISEYDVPQFAEDNNLNVNVSIEIYRQIVRGRRETAGEGNQDPSRTPVIGKKDVAWTEDNEEIEYQWQVVEASDLVPSHTTELQENKNYPQALQPRDRSRTGMKTQINKISNNIRPEFLGYSPKVGDGAPVIGRDLIVESGNGRTIALQKAYTDNAETIDGYRSYVNKQAELLGFDPAEVAEFNNPVLVRKRLSDKNSVDFARKANVSSIASMSNTEIAQSDSDKLTAGLLDVFEPGKNGNILVSDNRRFLKGFMDQIIEPSEQNKYTTGEGQFNQKYIDRVRNAVFYYAYSGAKGVALLEKMADSTDNNIKNITNVLTAIAPKITKLKNMIATGNRHNLDISDNITNSAVKYMDLRNEGKSVENEFSQTNLYENITNIDRQLLHTFEKYKNSPKKLFKVLEGYFKLVDAEGNPNQKELFEAALSSETELLQLANELVDKGLDIYDDDTPSYLLPKSKTIIEKAFQKFLGNPAFEIVDGNPNHPEIDRIVKSITGKNIIWFKDTIDGVHFKGRIYLNIDNSQPLDFVAKHEATHHAFKQLTNIEQETLIELSKMILGTEYDSMIEEYIERGYSEKQAPEEFLADYAATHLNDATFWKTLANNNRSLFDRFFEFIKQVFDRFTAYLEKSEKDSPYLKQNLALTKTLTEMIGKSIESEISENNLISQKKKAPLSFSMMQPNPNIKLVRAKLQYWVSLDAGDTFIFANKEHTIKYKRKESLTTTDGVIYKVSELTGVKSDVIRAEMNNALLEKGNRLKNAIVKLKKLNAPDKNGTATVSRKESIQKQILQLEKGYKIGKLNQRDKLLLLKDEIIQYARENLPPTDLSKGYVVRIMQALAKADNPRKVKNAMKSIDAVYESAESTTIRRKIKRLLEVYQPGKRSGRLLGTTLTENQYKSLDMVREAIKMDAANVKERVFDAFEETDDPDFNTLNRLKYYETFSDIYNKTYYELMKAHDEILSIIQTGRMEHEKREFERRKLMDMYRQKVIDIASDGRGVLTEDELSALGLGKKEWWLNAFDNGMQNLEYLFDKMEVKDKTTGPMKGWITKHFSELAYKATEAEKKDISDTVQSLVKKHEEIFGVKGRKLIKLNNKFRNEVSTDITINIPGKNTTLEDLEALYGKGTQLPDSKIIKLKISQDEALEYWMKYQDPSLHETFMWMGYSAQTIAELEKFIDPRLLKWGKWLLNNYYQDSYDPINKVYEEIY